jgi:glucose/arabinose dehydrogenase
MFEAHSSVLDFVFYEGDQFPVEYKGDAFVALKGSWNRSADRLQGCARALQGWKT